MLKNKKTILRKPISRKPKNKDKNVNVTINIDNS